MRKIKFRGVGLKDNKYYYGFYTYITPFGEFPAIIDEDGFYNAVIKESVSQFCGVDADGKEIYEGDGITDDIGSEYIAKCAAIAERVPRLKTSNKVEVVGSYYLNENFSVHKK